MVTPTSTTCWSFVRRYFSTISVSLDYNLQMSIGQIKENRFTLKKTRSRQYPTETMTDAEYADNQALLINTLTQAESSLHSLEEAAGGIDLYMNSDKTELMCFK